MDFTENKLLSREWRSNPYLNSSLNSRLTIKGAIDLRENFYVKNINDSYDEILPIDEKKKYVEV